MMRRLCLFGVMIALLAPGMAAAQVQHSAATPALWSPVQSMIRGAGQDQPVQIEAASLEVRDKSGVATFSGNVRVVQGDTMMECQKLVVFYGEEAKPPKPAGDALKSAQNIRRIACSGIKVVTKDQNASGDLGVYDLVQKTITLTGNVAVSPR
jgi:lipopolysaccharide export system protein LptA